MALLDLFVLASLPVVKVLLITAIGSVLALECIDILGENARHHLNKVLFYVFNPSLVAGNLVKTVTFESFITLWFMPVNILMTFIIGSVLGCIIVKAAGVRNNLKGLVIGACSAGNLGGMLIILVPAMCKEKGNPFGETHVCETYALSYASLSLAIGAIYLWLYVYNIVRVSVGEAAGETDADKEPLIPSTADHGLITSEEYNPVNSSSTSLMIPIVPGQISLASRVIHFLRTLLLEKINIKAVFAPSTIAAIVGFAIGMNSSIRNLMIGNDAPLHIVTDSAFMLGDAAIPTVTIIVGANLLQGLKGTGIQRRVVIGIVIARYIILPLSGILIVNGAIQVGFVPPNNKLFVFLLLLQHAMPPAMNLGTMMQLFGAGKSECSVIMLWTYASAPVFLTLWSTIFLWIVT
ncbi:protein PIN-LIKES 1 isoform X1 [Beta vulgaris subsp. vulgaris]|uniref:protein PIN-LIKES 1 isoform X1 n=1 Tax=Beta vulgaris subsp. vulgaris TaxID=3555 RepID=UPI002547ED57|nr:protein PIN-LIKES 1 isoform X1 [Beta vulgaris subsp. vulgaris]